MHILTFLLLVFIGNGAIEGLATAATPSSGTPLAVYGYLPEWRFLRWPEEEQSYRWTALGEHVSHLIIFSLEITTDGALSAMDRFPSDSALRYAHTARTATGMKLLISFGGNSRTAGFPDMATTPSKRKRFLSALSTLLNDKQLDGVDYNWEYPRNAKEWAGLASLVSETRTLFPSKTITVAYYPDGRQEKEMAKLQHNVDALLAMSYDQNGKHSTMGLAVSTIQTAKAAGLHMDKVCLGLPFYSRNIHSGDWKTYEDLYRQHTPADSTDQIGDDYFNGRSTLAAKAKLASEHNLGGLMIWEIGQDAFDNEARGMKRGASLLERISEATGRVVEEEEL